MFELHRAKKDWEYFEKENIKDIRWVPFHPEDHELRFYQFMFPIIEKTRMEDWEEIRDHYEIKIDGKWKHICIWELITRDEEGNLKVYSRPYWHARWEYEEAIRPDFDCIEWIIFEDDEWEYHVATSRSPSWNVCEEFFVNEYRRLSEEWAERGYRWFYDELERRTFTHIEDKPFLDLSNY